MERTAGSRSSTEDAEARTARVVLGRVVGAHGLRGVLRVRHFGGEPDNWTRNPEVWLAESEADPEPQAFEVEAVAAGRRNEFRVTLAGVADRDAAEALRGRLVLGDAERLESLPEGEYYGFQLVGCRVEGEDGSEIGTVREIWSTGAPDVLVVDGVGGREHLIPAAEGLLREVDIEARRIVIEVLPGLLEPA